MPERYIEAIIKFLSDREYHPLKPRQIARQMGIADQQFGAFREAVKRLRDSGRIVMGASDALTLPAMASRVRGVFRANQRGFGFILPDEPNAHGDLFIPAENTAGALNGDTVVARAFRQGKRDGKHVFAGEIIQIVQRGTHRVVGTLEQAQNTWFVLPDGKHATPPVVIRDIGVAGPKSGDKVVAEIVKYGEVGELPIGVIVETLGKGGQVEVETLSVIRAHGLEDEFSEQALADARKSIDKFDPHQLDGREDITDWTVVTIDPPDARDFDDAISLTADDDGKVTLGVHIADVSHFVREGMTLDEEAAKRATSVYFPRKVIPMLPEILSNGVCSLQEGQRRFCKSAMITYNSDGKVISSRLAETIICSSKRLTYLQAQDICDGKVGGYDKEVVELVGAMEKLARKIETRRRDAGMIHLDLPAVELEFDDNNRVIGAGPTDDSYTHTIIEMFMVEANEAAASLLTKLDRKFLRRIHPAPDAFGSKQFSAFVKACGHKTPTSLTHHDIQDLLAAVKGKPESYAVNLAVLKTFQRAEYSPMQIGHFALASEHYCHFTSPIRRYPDLTVHRLIAEHCRGLLESRPPEDLSELVALGERCSAAERKAEAAESELRNLLVLQLIATKVGEVFAGVIVGITNFGVFVQLERFLVEGLVRLEDLGDDWWEVSARYGLVRGERSGITFRIGDRMEVLIAAVDLPKRQLNLSPSGNRDRGLRSTPKKKSRGKGAKPKGKGRGPKTKRKDKKRG